MLVNHLHLQAQKFSRTFNLYFFKEDFQGLGKLETALGEKMKSLEFKIRTFAKKNYHDTKSSNIHSHNEIVVSF